MPTPKKVKVAKSVTKIVRPVAPAINYDAITAAVKAAMPAPRPPRFAINPDRGTLVGIIAVLTGVVLFMGALRTPTVPAPVLHATVGIDTATLTAAIKAALPAPAVAPAKATPAPVAHKARKHKAHKAKVTLASPRFVYVLAAPHCSCGL